MFYLSTTDNYDIANTAASMVNVTYTDVQQPLLDFHKAIEQKSFFTDPINTVVVGDADRELFIRFISTVTV